MQQSFPANYTESQKKRATFIFLNNFVVNGRAKTYALHKVV